MPSISTSGSPPRAWYRITCQADAAAADIWVYDVIGTDPWTGEGVSAKSFLAELAALPETVRTLVLHVNSPGGSVFDAVAIANLLRAQSTERGRTIEVRIEGLAASAASIITSAGDAIKIASNAILMIHNPSGMVRGEAKDMRAMAEALDGIRGAMVATYRWVSPLAADAIQALMDATTWMNAEEALANGFVTEIMAPVAVTAQFRPEALASLGEIPEQYRERVAALVEQPSAPPDAVVTVDVELTPQAQAVVADLTAATVDASAILAACREAGCLDLAEELVAAHATPEQVTARLQQEQARRTADADRRAAVQNLCAMAKLPELADGYIADGVSVASVQAHLTTITAKMHDTAIITSLPADGGATARVTTGIITAEIYRQRAEIAAKARDGQKGV